MNKYLIIALSFSITIASYASEEITYKKNNCVNTFKKGSLIVQHDECNNLFQAFMEKITKIIDDNGMLHFKREIIKQEQLNAQKIYWDLYDAYLINQAREPNEIETNITEVSYDENY